MMTIPRWGTLAILCGTLVATATQAQTPTRVVLFVGDGAGVAHWTVARFALDSLAVDQFDALGLSDTRGANHTVTESAAGGTAFATGVRTFPGALSVGPDSQPHETVLEAAQRRGMATGVITTTYVIDATPASMFSHVTSRRMVSAIMPQLLEHHPTVILGGGREMFTGIRFNDSLTFLDAFRSRYTYVDSAPQLAALRLDTVTALLGLFAVQDLPLAPERHPSLAQLTETALTVLDRDPQGFFLLVENEETDTEAHANQPFAVIAAEMQALDEAIRSATAYQRRHPETLIVVLADHETGGMAVGVDSTGAPALAYSTRGHTADMVPIFAKGPGAERFRGVVRNDEIGRRLLAAVRGRH